MVFFDHFFFEASGAAKSTDVILGFGAPGSPGVVPAAGPLATPAQDVKNVRGPVCLAGELLELCLFIFDGAEAGPSGPQTITVDIQIFPAAGPAPPVVTFGPIGPFAVNTFVSIPFTGAPGPILFGVGDRIQLGISGLVLLASSTIQIQAETHWIQ